MNVTLPHLQNMVAARLRVPGTGGIATNTSWTVSKAIGMHPSTWARLEALAETLSARGLARVKPHQLAALLLELVVEETA